MHSQEHSQIKAIKTIRVKPTVKPYVNPQRTGDKSTTTAASKKDASEDILKTCRQKEFQEFFHAEQKMWNGSEISTIWPWNIAQLALTANRVFGDSSFKLVHSEKLAKLENIAICTLFLHERASITLDVSKQIRIQTENGCPLPFRSSDVLDNINYRTKEQNLL